LRRLHGDFLEAGSPQLRLGYLIFRSDPVKSLVKLRHYTDYFPPMSMQPVIAEFIDGGH
jgi:DNA-binding transcriptional MocR family regulator